jgi:uncharacterized protein (TIGR02145 family)
LTSKNKLQIREFKNVTLNKMKSGIQSLIFLLVLLGAISILTNSCKKNNNDSSLPEGTVTDADGNVYHTLKIGTQIWMAENLKTTKYNDGTAIPLVTDNTTWKNLSTPGYCWYNNEGPTFKYTYGALYNWYTVNTGKLSPKGWHVPTDAEWEILVTFLGGDTIAGGKMKETGTAHWLPPNKGSTNSSGFTALPSGGRSYVDGSFSGLGHSTDFWSSTEVDSVLFAFSRLLYPDTAFVYHAMGNKKFGSSVRCLQDN